MAEADSTVLRISHGPRAERVTLADFVSIRGFMRWVLAQVLDLMVSTSEWPLLLSR